MAGVCDYQQTKPGIGRAIQHVEVKGGTLVQELLYCYKAALLEATTITEEDMQSILDLETLRR